VHDRQVPPAIPSTTFEDDQSACLEATAMPLEAMLRARNFLINDVLTVAGRLPETGISRGTRNLPRKGSSFPERDNRVRSTRPPRRSIWT
jgi:hypothetical protein